MAQLPENLLGQVSRALSSGADVKEKAEAAARYLLERKPEADNHHLDEVVALIVCCYTEAAKIDLTQDELKLQIQRSGVTDKQCEAISSVYKSHRAEFRKSLLRIGWHPPHVLNADWKLNYCVKGNVQGTIAKPSYLVSFKVQDCDTTAPRDFIFNCSVDQLQDLVWKLKEATRTVQKIANQGS